MSKNGTELPPPKFPVDNVNPSSIALPNSTSPASPENTSEVLVASAINLKRDAESS